MNKIIQNNSQQTISTFDLIETFHIESQSLHQQIKAISQTINSLIQIAKTVNLFFALFSYAYSKKMKMLVRHLQTWGYPIMNSQIYPKLIKSLVELTI